MKTMPRHLLCGAFLVLVLLPLGSGCLVTTSVYDDYVERGGNTRKVLGYPQAFINDRRELLLQMTVVRGRGEPDQPVQPVHLTIKLDAMAARLRRQAQDARAGQAAAFTLDPAPLHVRRGWPLDAAALPPGWRAVPVQLPSAYRGSVEYPSLPVGVDEQVVVGTGTSELDVLYLSRNGPLDETKALRLVDRQELVANRGWWVYPLTPLLVVADAMLLPVLVPLYVGAVIWWYFDPPTGSFI
jgi:hypothetical protein